MDNQFLRLVKENLDKPVYTPALTGIDKTLHDWKKARGGNEGADAPEIHKACNCVDDQGFSLVECKGDCYGARQYEATMKAMGYSTPLHEKADKVQGHTIGGIPITHAAHCERYYQSNCGGTCLSDEQADQFAEEMAHAVNPLYKRSDNL